MAIGCMALASKYVGFSYEYLVLWLKIDTCCILARTSKGTSIGCSDLLFSARESGVSSEWNPKACSSQTAVISDHKYTKFVFPFICVMANAKSV